MWDAVASVGFGHFGFRVHSGSYLGWPDLNGRRLSLYPVLPFNPVQQNRDGNNAKWTMISFTYSWFYGPTERLKPFRAAPLPQFPAPMCTRLFVVCKPGRPTRTSTKLCLMMVSAILAQDFSFLSHGRFFSFFFFARSADRDYDASEKYVALALILDQREQNPDCYSQVIPHRVRKGEQTYLM